MPFNHLHQCYCKCHDHCGVRHIKPCCRTCPICERHIHFVYFDAHHMACQRLEEKGVLAYIAPIIRAVWCAATAAPWCCQTWTADNPARGQCVVTALLIQHFLQGDVLRTEIESFGSHYYNRLPSGDMVDLTAEQFPKGTTIPPGKPCELNRFLTSKEAKRARTEERFLLLLELFASYRRPKHKDD